MNTLCRFVHKLFPAAIGSQHNSTLICYKKQYEGEMPYYFCDKLGEIIFLIALEAVKFDSSMEPNNVSEFTWPTCFNTKIDVFSKCFSSVAEI